MQNWMTAHSSQNSHTYRTWCSHQKEFGNYMCFKIFICDITAYTLDWHTANHWPPPWPLWLNYSSDYLKIKHTSFRNQTLFQIWDLCFDILVYEVYHQNCHEPVKYGLCVLKLWCVNCTTKIVMNHCIVNYSTIEFYCRFLQQVQNKSKIPTDL